MKRKRIINPQVTFTGIIIATAWDKNEDIIGANISTANEEEYYINPNIIGKKLFKYEAREVKVTGMVIETENKTKMIVVNDYLVLS